MEQITIRGRFNGPRGSANGGYTCGLVAELLGGEAEVTLRSPPPLDRPLDVEREVDRVRILDGERVVAEASPAEVELELPVPPSYQDAEAASTKYPGFEDHAFPTCFVCGPDRMPGDGLRIFAGPLGDSRVASPWVPTEVEPKIVWAALDCPGAWALGVGGRPMVLGTMTAEVDRLPAVGEEHVVMAWASGSEGRKHYCGTALYARDGALLARADATWIAIDPAAIRPVRSTA